MKFVLFFQNSILIYLKTAFSGFSFGILYLHSNRYKNDLLIFDSFHFMYYLCFVFIPYRFSFVYFNQ